MLSYSNLQILINYISENFILCQYKNGDSVFTELLKKEDVFDNEHSIKEILL